MWCIIVNIMVAYVLADDTVQVIISHDNDYVK